MTDKRKASQKRYRMTEGGREMQRACDRRYRASYIGSLKRSLWHSEQKERRLDAQIKELIGDTQ